jgi:serine/threonine-protein kinase HipA
MKQNEIKIWVYADWDFLHEIQLMGFLTEQKIRGKEIFSFEYEEKWINNQNPILFLDPNLGFYKGKQYLPEEKNNFGIFLDSSPDRWGKLLMRRKEAWLAKKEGKEEKTLFESDYLLGVFDGNRMGGLRFKLSPDGPFVNDNKKMATPPWTSLKELAHASLQLERTDATKDPDYTKWLTMLIDPGSSLGGARPKASVIDENGHLWIAKFPSANDHKNVGAWEMVLHQLAESCGIKVSEARLQKFSSNHHTFLSKRFDRTPHLKRIHFSSAMTLLGLQDGADYNAGIGYLDLVGFIMQNSPEAKQDLEQLWRRVLFNVLVSNTDDHLRNHGFLLTKQGWRLSPAYDMNPNEFGTGLTLNISENSNELDVSLVIETASLFQLDKNQAENILKDMKSKISKWPLIAKKVGISTNEIELTKRAFKLAE